MSTKGKVSQVGQVIDGRFQVAARIGAGAFGDIYLVEEVTTGNKYAAKFESLKSNFLQLPTEYRVFQAIRNVEVGFPRSVHYQKTSTDVVLVMDLLGKNLKELFEICDKKFSVKTILYIAIACITRMETLHGKNFVYRDVKPENFMIGLPGTEAAKTIHLIDFGMVKEYMDLRTGQHIPMRKDKPVTGTARYMSRNSHFKIELSRRDDLESLAYMWLFFFKGSLPWSGNMTGGMERNAIQQSQRIGSMKQALRPEDLFEAFPQEFAKYLNYVRNLAFEETPDYEMLRKSFIDLFPKLGLEDDGAFDWDDKLNINELP